MAGMDSEHDAQLQVPTRIGNTPLTLEPLRTHGRDTVDVRNIKDLARITLREVQVTWDNEFHETIVRRADDIFNCVTAEGVPYDVVPKYGKLTRATFDVQFADSPKVKTVEICLPNNITLPPGCDAGVIERWLVQRGFRGRG